ncbi:MAG: M48 family metalloprotease [Acidobacteriota bacterium]
MSRFFSLALALVFTVPWIGCATNPATGKTQLALISEQQEIAMGRQSDQQIVASLGLYPDEEAQRYVSDLGQRLAAASERPNLPWTFRVVDDPVVNAFALPGGFIYITRGILTHMNNEAELAAVLGHEIGHVTGRHSVSRLSKAQLATLGLGIGMMVEPSLQRAGNLLQTGMGLLFLKYGRDDERQADDLGLRYLRRADYDPMEMIGVFEMLGAVSRAAGAEGRVPGWLATHPPPENRRERIAAAVAAAGETETGREVGTERFLERVSGMTFGPNPREGYFEGSTFYHPDMAFRLDFPDGWKTVNQRQQVIAISPQEDAAMVLRLAQGDSPEAAAREFFSQQGIRRGNALGSVVRGLSSSGNYFSVPREQAEDIVGLAAFIGYREQVFQLMGYTMEPRWQSVGTPLQSSVASFSRLTDRRILNIEPKRVEIFTLPRELTLEEVNWRWPSSVPIETLELINRVQRGDRLAAGTKIKRVLGGE